jgi:hypothetical protein
MNATRYLPFAGRLLIGLAFASGKRGAAVDAQYLARPEEPTSPSISYLNGCELANGDTSKTDWTWRRWRHALGDAFLPIL